jgi:hypothetical protein
MKNGKTPGVDNILAGLFRVDVKLAVDKIHEIIVIIWRNKAAPKGWSRGIMKVMYINNQCAFIIRDRTLG